MPGSDPTSSDRTPDVLWAMASELFTVVGPDDRFRSVNPAWERLLGFTEEELVGRPLLDVVDPRDRPAVLRTLAGEEVVDGRVGNYKSRLVGKDGVAHTIAWDGFTDGDCWYAVGRDVTDEERRRREHDDHVHRQAQLLDAVDVAVVATTPDRVVTHWNSEAVRLFGRPADEVIGRNIGRLIVRAGDADLARGIAHTAGAAGSWEGQMELRRSDGSTFPALVRMSLLRDERDRPRGFVGVVVDLTTRIRAENELRAARDYLRAVTDSMGEGLCTLDLEGRLVYMNAAAERMLGWTGEELLGRPLDQMPRAGEDGVVCGETTFTNRDGDRFDVEYTAAPFRTSQGVRGTAVVFSDISERKRREEEARRELATISWVERIRAALDEERFVLHAQPIVDIKTGETVQHELLIRMVDTDGSVIPPGRFLPVAEAHGLIGAIDRWVVGQACRLAARGHAVELNVSAQSLADPQLARFVGRELEASKADPALLVFEITETSLIEDEAVVARFIDEVRAHGCRFALDDFGTGYGGFTYLKRLAVEYLKIDIEFVRDLLRDDASRHVVNAVVSLAGGFGQRTVAEGVEDDETLELLRELGVDYAQGYGIGRPAPVEEVLGRLPRAA